MPTYLEPPCTSIHLHRFPRRSEYRMATAKLLDGRGGVEDVVFYQVEVRHHLTDEASSKLGAPKVRDELTVVVT